MALFGPLYERVMRWSRHPHAEWYLGAMSFAESSFFPIPVDVMLAPMCMAMPERSWRYALNASLLSVAGGIAGYAIGLLAFEAIEPWLRDSQQTIFKCSVASVTFCRGSARWQRKRRPH